MKSFLFDKATISLSEFISYAAFPVGQGGVRPSGLEDAPLETPVPIAQRPDSFIVVVAGGNLPYHWQWLPLGGAGKVAITTNIELPTKWKELLSSGDKTQ